VNKCIEDIFRVFIINLRTIIMLSNSHTKHEHSYDEKSCKNYGRIREWSIVSALAIVLAVSSTSIIGTSLSPSNVWAAVDADSSGEGIAAAFDGENSMSTSGSDTFCTVVDYMADGRFASLFEGVVDCDAANIAQDSKSNQFLIEYSFEKDPVKIGEVTYLTISVKDKNTGNPVSNAFVRLVVEPPSDYVGGAGKATQGIYTDELGRAMFTVKIGPESTTGLYNTQLEIRKDSYLSGEQSTNFRVV
jgi:hypothetical protein